MPTMPITALPPELERLVRDAGEGDDLVFVDHNGQPIAAVGPAFFVEPPGRAEWLAQFPQLDTDAGRMLEEDRR